MRRRDRSSGTAVDEVAASRPSPSGDGTTTSAPVHPLTLVDEALRVASRRELFTREEVFGLLHEVESASHGSAAAERVDAIVHEADRGTGDQIMCSRADLVNPLLDIRLALVN